MKLTFPAVVGRGDRAGLKRGREISVPTRNDDKKRSALCLQRNRSSTTFPDSSASSTLNVVSGTLELRTSAMRCRRSWRGASLQPLSIWPVSLCACSLLVSSCDVFALSQSLARRGAPSGEGREGTPKKGAFFLLVSPSLDLRTFDARRGVPRSFSRPRLSPTRGSNRCQH